MPKSVDNSVWIKRAAELAARRELYDLHQIYDICGSPIGISKGKPDMPTVESKPITLKVLFLAESDRGYTISNNCARTWLPRRLCEISPAGAAVGEIVSATMPDWLAHESGLLSGSKPSPYSIAKLL